MNCIVTGAAGFIGSHLCERLLDEGHRVVGIDCFTPYYPRHVKERNLAVFRRHANLEFFELDLSRTIPVNVLSGAEWVFHLAAMPGLVKSWTDFDLYNLHNITATHRLLEALKGLPTLDRFVYASTSSVYGLHASGDETLPIRPSSPYGITKLAGENLCRVYADHVGFPVTILRYFSVFGPRQRPEMGYYQFIQAVLDGMPIQLTGDGSQLRGNTYVSDCVAATVAAVQTLPGQTFNVGGGEVVAIADVIKRIERLTGCLSIVHRLPERPGDQRATGADASKLTKQTGWRPTVGIDEGLERQIDWQKLQSYSRVA